MLKHFMSGGQQDDDTGNNLELSKFEALMSFDISGFEESGVCFMDMASKLKSVVDADRCRLYLASEADSTLYTYITDEGGEETQGFKPLDQGITSTVYASGEGVNCDNVYNDGRWEPEIDEYANYKTVHYMAYPLKSFEGECIGLVEARNKMKGDGFTVSDDQLMRIFAHNLSSAVQSSKQSALIADRNEHIHKAYEKNLDDTEKIQFTESTEEEQRKLSERIRNQIQAASVNLGVKVETASQIQRWDYDVFSESAEQLKMLAIDCFEDRGLFTRFSINIDVFLSFADDIMAGYSTETPYHNYFHAFDVMHVSYLLVSTCEADAYLEDFNILSLLVGALAHDIGHDGFNNAYHANTMSELAIMYNSISIMENFSAAFLFRILKKEKSNVLARLPETDLKKMRTRLIDMILDTDAKNHFILMTRFKHGLEMKQLSRGLLSSMILHIADVSNPARPGFIARKWAYAVQEEFFQQGDKERELGMAVSAFMDREHENLPRMQGAFVDALVAPIFALTAQFLPKLTGNCVKTLQVNRAFWTSLQNQHITKTPQIQEMIDNRLEDGSESSVNESERVRQMEQVNLTGVSTSIPGIPENAPHSPNNNMRKLSLVAMKSKEEEKVLDLSSQASNINLNEDVNLTPLSPRALVKRAKELKELRRVQTLEILDGNWVQLVMLTATIYALFADDMSLWFGDKDNDPIISVITFVVLLMFSLELFVSLYCVPEYIQFFFWLDLVAALSLIPEIDFFHPEEEVTASTADSVTDQATLARAGRAAKAGARAGRLARVLRLIRLVRIIKLMKWMGSLVKKRYRNAMQENEEEEKEVELKMSNVGRKMTESITRKVILAVMFMLLMFALQDAFSLPDARTYQLKDISLLALNDISTETLALKDKMKINYMNDHSNLIRLDLNDTWRSDMTPGEGPLNNFAIYFDEDAYNSLRSSEIEVIVAGEAEAWFDIHEETSYTAMLSFITTVVVTFLLAVLSMLFSRDAYNIMIRPIEKMKHTVQQLSENPLLHLEKLKSQPESVANEESETDMLEQAITKMARLLQIGFGSAGAEIIANNLGDGGTLNPMVPGTKVDAIFGFCDIRDFTFATEGLQEDVMLFVNKVAAITHKYVVESGGAPNKNIGDAFLLVWKLKNENGKGDLQKDIFDSALFAFLRIVADIKRMSNLAAFLEEADENAAWRSTLEDFKVHMGFGLHSGWAIEGSIGSSVKVDASYLSPHVNLASRLEAATKQFRVPILMSDDFVKGLTGSTQSSCRRVDSVTFKGSSEPMHIFHFDSEPFEVMAHKPSNYEQLFEATEWHKEEDAVNAGLNIKDIAGMLDSTKEVIVRQVYEMAFHSYIDGDWEKCKCIFHMWIEKFPGDVLAQVLIERLMKLKFVVPEDWQGYHSLSEK